MAETKYVIRKLERGEDGTMRIVYVDAKSGEVVTNLNGYQVISQGQAERARLTDATEENKGERRQSAARSVTQPQSSGDDSTLAGRVGAGGGLGLGGIFDRSAGNNYGYIDLPNWLGLASMVPGPIGTVAKLGGAAGRINNTMASNAAREGMGLGNLGLGRTIGNVLGMRDDSVAANINVGDTPYSVGFEALNKKGQTTLTPNEARMRGLVTGRGIAEMKGKEAREWQKEFAEEFPGQRKGLLSGVKSFFGSRASEPEFSYADPDLVSYRNSNYSDLGSPGSLTYTSASNVPDSAVPVPASRPSGGLGGTPAPSSYSYSPGGGPNDPGMSGNSSNSFGSASTAATGGGTDDNFSGW